MNVRTLRIRRSLTLAGALAAIVLGFAAIQAAAAWTADAAPLVVSPTSAKTLEARLVDEQTRSAALETRLGELTGNADQLSAALEAAQRQIKTDNVHAAGLAKDLKAAAKKLATLQQSIRLATQTVAVPTPTSPARAPIAPARGDDGDGGRG